MKPFYTVFRHYTKGNIIAISSVILGQLDKIIYHNEDMDYDQLIDTARSKTKVYDDEHELISGIFEYGRS